MTRLIAVLAVLALVGCATPIQKAPRTINDALLKAHEDSEAGR